MDCRAECIAAGAALALLVLALPGPGLAQTSPYPKPACDKLAKDLATALPIPGPYTVEVEWFREGDLGLKGQQCHIVGEGPLTRDKALKPPAKIADMVAEVTKVLKTHGFKGGKLLKRYRRTGKAYRAFALRKDRATCWTNLEVGLRVFPAPKPSAAGQDQAARPKSPPDKKPPAKPQRVWLINVDCFVG